MIPSRHLRPLTLHTPTRTTDAYGADAVTGWTASTITGRVDQTSRSEDHANARQAALSDWLLLTNAATVTDTDRIIDGATTYEVTGTPWPVYRTGSTVHHYEATLRLVEG